VLVGLRSDSVRDHYGFAVDLSDALADDCIQDGSGDRLDAVLCAVQAAWAHLQRDHNYGIPRDCDRNEGWIVDPWLQERLANGWGSSATSTRRSCPSASVKRRVCASDSSLSGEKKRR
jgi:hypothetical protein